MAYTITRTNGQNPIVIPDGTINTETTVVLVGKNFPNYGAILDQNFLRMLENSANSSPPSAPVTGELWWDSNNITLKVYAGGAVGWKNVGSTTAQATRPNLATSNLGDLWWDTANGQLKAYDGALQDYKLIGPIGGAAGIEAETLYDSITLTAKDVLSFKIASNRYAILSSSPEFSPNISINGFSSIRPGLNIADTSFLTNARLSGIATDAVSLNGLYANSFMTSGTNTSTTGTLSVLNNNGLYVGAASNFHVSVTNSPNVAVINETNNGAMNFRVRNGSGQLINAMDIYPNGNIIANYDFVVAGNINFANSTNDFLVTGSSQSTNTVTGALRVTAGGFAVAGNINSGGSVNNFVGNVRAANLIANNTVSTTTVSATNLGGTLTTAVQPNITSVGTLGTLVVSGTISSGAGISGILTTNAQPFVNSLGTLSSLTVSGALNATVATAAQPNITSLGNLSSLSVAGVSALGANTNVRITGGAAGQFLRTDGAGNLSWASLSLSGTTNAVAFFNSTSGLTGNSSLTFNGSTLVVTGAITATGDITAFLTSDGRLKTDIKPITNALDKLSTLSGVTFLWNELGKSLFDTAYPSTDREAGLIAQEVQNVLPEVVTLRDNGYLAVRYEKVVPLLVEAIKELKAELDKLKSK